MTGSHKVFVYGTLKTGEPNHSVLLQPEGQFKFLGIATTVDAFPLVVGTHINIPFLLYQRGGGVPVQGEVYEVDDRKLIRLDKLEKHPVFYERKLEKVRMVDNEDAVHDAWMYFIPKWSDEFSSKCSVPISSYTYNGTDHGRLYLSGRLRETITYEEGATIPLQVLGHPIPDGYNITRVFVYGTLKRGEPNYSVMSETEGASRFSGEATTVSSFPLVVGTQFNIPFLLNQRGSGHQIKGELYEVNMKKLEILDELEAHPILYERKLEKVVIDETGTTVDAWVYIIHKWDANFESTCSKPMDSYSTTGSHGRPYLDRYVRAKLMKEEETNLFKEIMGYDPREDGCTIGVGKAPEGIDQ